MLVSRMDVPVFGAKPQQIIQPSARSRRQPRARHWVDVKQSHPRPSNKRVTRSAGKRGRNRPRLHLGGLRHKVQPHEERDCDMALIPTWLNSGCLNQTSDVSLPAETATWPWLSDLLGLFAPNTLKPGNVKKTNSGRPDTHFIGRKRRC